MNPDQHLQHYFAARADDIAVPRTGTPALAERARRRRHRRTGVKVAAVVSVLAIGGAVIAQRGDDGQDVASYGNAVVPTDLRWTVVTPQSALGYSQGATTAADGTTYDLSSAPGRRDPNSTGEPQRLYRSTDGADWATADLPDGLWASDLAATGDRLYAVGTSPAGGGTERVRLAATSTGGADWSDVDLPLDLPAIGAGFPVGARISSTHVATVGDTTVVSVGVSVALNRLPQLAGQNWRIVDGGVDLVEPPACEAEAEARERAESAEVDIKGGCTDADDDQAPVTQHYEWADLGVDPSAVGLVDGRTYLFAIGADGVATPSGELPAAANVIQLLGGPDGFWAIVSRGSENEAYLSTDGLTWPAERPVALSGYPLAAGYLAGRPTVAVDGPQGGRLVLETLAPAGATSTDVGAALGDLLDGRSVDGVAFGPLGFAAVIPGGEATEPMTVVHGTGDGQLSVVEVTGEPEGQYESLVGVQVSADAVTLRLTSSVPGDASPGSPPTGRTRLFVGTPG